MTTKLTLTLNPVTISKAKLYAKKQHTSISRIVEHHLEQLSEMEEQQTTEKQAAFDFLSQNILPLDDGREYKVILAEEREKKFSR